MYFIPTVNSKDLPKLKHSFGIGRSTIDKIDRVNKKDTMVTDAPSPLQLIGIDWIADKIEKKSKQSKFCWKDEQVF